jgi:hypothetical protein
VWVRKGDQRVTEGERPIQREMGRQERERCEGSSKGNRKKFEHWQWAIGQHQLATIQVFMNDGVSLI